MYEECLKHVNVDVTEDIKKFVHDDVFRNSEYLFVSKEGNNHKGYCSFCNHEYEVTNLAHNYRCDILCDNIMEE